MHDMLMAHKKNVSTPEEQEVRARVLPEVKAAIEEMKAQSGLDHKQIVARLLRFLYDQDRFVRSALLGQFEIDKNFRAMIIERLRLDSLTRTPGQGGTWVVDTEDEDEDDGKASAKKPA
jgi:hypothetical protein